MLQKLMSPEFTRPASLLEHRSLDTRCSSQLSVFFYRYEFHPLRFFQPATPADPSQMPNRAMRQILIVIVLGVAGWAQNGGVIPAPDIAKEAGEVAAAPAKAQSQAAQTALIKQQTQLLKQQTEALKQQNALMEQQKQFISAVRKPRIDDIDAVTGKPRFATYAEYEDAKDEWLIEEAMRRFEALHPSSK